jgi:hypothetical protein
MLALALSLSLSPAWAGYPQDILVSGMDSYQGQPSGTAEEVNQAWRTVVKDLGTGIANKAQGGATLGMDGFDLSMGASTVFVHGHRYNGGPTAWELAREGNQAAGALFIPELQVRKGLPLSLEAGARVGWISFTRQGLVGAFGRFAPIEGHPKLPELAMQLGYTGYVGNDELDLGVADASLSLGKTVAFASMQASKTRTIHPHAGVGFNWIRANPLLSEERLGELNIAPMRAKKSAPDYDPEMRQLVIHAGMRIVSGDVGFHLGMAAPLDARPTLDTRVGFVF